MSSWAVDPATKDFVIDETGNPIDSRSLIYPARNRLVIRRNNWLYAPDDLYGSDFYLIKKRFNGSDISGLTDIGQRALQPMIDDGRASAVDIVADTSQQPARGNAPPFTITIFDAEGNPESLNLPPLGV